MLDPLYHLAANAIVFFHKGFGPIFGAESFFAWAFSVILLVVCVRIVIFPLFVKQVKSQRTMQMMQPRIKEIKEKYGHDKPRMQQEIMELQREHGNPLLGCLPIVLQIPLFIALFHVFNSLHPATVHGKYVFVPRVGLSAAEVQSIATAKLWGVSLSTALTSKSSIVSFLGADSTHIKIVAVVLILLMGATTFFTQKQIIGRAGSVDPQQQMIQKVMLYGSPLTLAVFGFRFPIAVLLYWLTTNLWSMGQQFFVIRRMPPVVPLGPNGKIPGARPGAGGKTPTTQVSVSKPAPGVKPAGKGAPRGAAAKATPSAKTSQPAGKSQASKTGGTRPSRAPAGTSSRSGRAGGAGPSGAEPKNSPSSTNGAGPTSGGQPEANGAGSGRPSVDKADTSAGGAGGSTGNGSSGSAGSGTARQPSVAAGARRPPGGARPAKKRSKGGRRGGRR
ncbi:MAG: membrane protein insertase YidC [Frankia sp.]